MRDMALPVPMGCNRLARKARPDAREPRPGRIRLALDSRAPDYRDLAVRMGRAQAIGAERSA